MPVKIRLMRIGTKKRPFYRVIAVDERKKRTGTYLELLGTYNPLIHPHEIVLKQDRIDDWIRKGAVLSEGYLRIIGKAPQRPARKPKRERKEELPSSSEPAGTDTTVEEAQSETPAETTEEQPTMEADTPATETVESSTESTTEETKEE